MLPTTTGRVPNNTADWVNDRIREQSDRSAMQAIAGGDDAIRRRLAELNAEWDIERTLAANAAALATTGAVLALAVDRRFALVPAVVGGFLLMHALQGWCPPLPVFRRLGVRTADEIDRERDRLRAAVGRGAAVGSPVPNL